MTILKTPASCVEVGNDLNTISLSTYPASRKELETEMVANLAAILAPRPSL